MPVSDAGHESSILSCDIMLKHFFQRLFRGWSDKETWNLDYEFYKWLLPRLKRFRKVSLTVPKNKTSQEWDLELKAVIAALEMLEDEVIYFSEHRKFEEAKEFVNKWFYENIKHLHW